MSRGRLVAWSIDRATASGLPDVALGDLVEIEGSGRALVTALLRERVELAPTSSRIPARGAAVRRLGPFVVPAGDDLIARTVNSLAEPRDGGAPIERGYTMPVFARQPATLRDRGQGRWTLGSLVYDLQRFVPLGASLLGVGPIEIAHRLMKHQHAEGRVCIVATIAATPPRHLDLRRGETPCVHVAVGGDPAPAAQWLAPWTALAIASGMRARGRDVVVLLDNVDVWRHHARRFQLRGSWSTQLAQLASHAWAVSDGSVSLLALAKEQTPALAIAFDGTLDLELALRGEPERYATKIESPGFAGTRSIAEGRCGVSEVRPPIRVPAPMRLALAVADGWFVADIERRAPWRRLDRDTQKRLAEGRRVRESLRHRADAPIDTTEQIACLLAVRHISITELPEASVVAFVDAYLHAIRRDHAARLDEIRASKKLDEIDLHALMTAAEEVATELIREA